MDIILRNACLKTGELVDIAIEDGVITQLEPEILASAKTNIDLAGSFTIPSFVNGHLHACKSDWRKHLPPDFDYSNLNARFAAIGQIKQRYTVPEVLERADASVRLAVRHGTGALRLFADVDNDAGLRAFEALMALKKRYAGLLELQIAAFPQNGVFGDKASTTTLLKQALDMGADVIGGIPWLEPTVAAQAEHIDLVLGLAQAYQIPAHLVFDDTDDPTSRTGEMVATKILQTTGPHSLVGQVCGTQSNALAFYDAAHSERVIGLYRRAGLTIFANAHVALVTTAQRRQPAPRGHAPILALLQAGVAVAAAQDDINNPYYPFGRNDLLEVAQYIAHLAPLAWGQQLDTVLEMVTTTPARAIGLSDYGLAVGCKANILVLDAPNWFEAIKNQSEKSLVILAGRVVARNRRQNELMLGDG
jgi:cytosine/creatinine deaminase